MLKRSACLLLPGLLLSLLGAYRLGYPPSGGAEVVLSELPMELLGLPGEEIPLDQAVLADLDSDGLLVRRYRRPDGLPVWVVLVYFVNTRLGGHDPQLCYLGQGYRVVDQPDLVLESKLGAITAESFLATRPGRSERVATFWYTAGGQVLSDVRRYRKELFLQGLRENRSYGIFVRVSTLESAIEADAERWNERFVAEVARQLPRIVREDR